MIEKLPAIPIRQKFPLGRINATPGALKTMLAAGQCDWFFVQRHAMGDWGNVPPDDARANEEALATGGRILSAYITLRGTKVWIITEADRSVTTLLTPDEY